MQMLEQARFEQHGLQSQPRLGSSGRVMGMPAMDMNLDDQTFHSVEGFAQAADRLEVPWTINSGGNEFSGFIRRREFGGLLFGELSYGVCSGTRGHREIDRSNDDYICLTVYNGGRMLLEQHGEVMEAGECDILLWDGKVPTRFDCLAPSHCEMIWLPRKIIERRSGCSEEFEGQVISGKEGIARLIAAHIKSLHRELVNIPLHQADGVIDAAIDFILSCLPRDVEPRFSNRHQFEIFAAAKRTINERIGMDRFGPSDIAFELGISVRYLHSLFHKYGTTFSNYVNVERLERAKRSLALQNSYTKISDIAHDLGFCDSSHFNRLFRQRFGITPNQYRRNLDS
jgi:AraC-like DNA-binding protein